MCDRSKYWITINGNINAHTIPNTDIFRERYYATLLFEITCNLHTRSSFTAANLTDCFDLNFLDDNIENSCGDEMMALLQQSEDSLYSVDQETGITLFLSFHTFLQKKYVTYVILYVLSQAHWRTRGESLRWILPDRSQFSTVS